MGVNSDIVLPILEDQVVDDNCIILPFTLDYSSYNCSCEVRSRNEMLIKAIFELSGWDSLVSAAEGSVIVVEPLGSRRPVVVEKEMGVA